MPVVRYLVFVGGFLLSLLFVVDYYFPAAAEVSTASEVDRSVIRIGSTRALPEKIVFDVKPSSVAAAAALPEDALEQPSPRASSQEALAMMPPTRPTETHPARAATEHNARRSRTVRSSRTAGRNFERRAAFDRRDFFDGW